MKNKISFAELMQQNGFQHLGKTTYRLYENGRPLGMRDYSSPKRAINAIREILRCAGYTM